MKRGRTKLTNRHYRKKRAKLAFKIALDHQIWVIKPSFKRIWNHGACIPTFHPGYVWHIPHRCHRREFLLKFARDRSRWMELLLEAKRRYRLSILNFIVTSNHGHLIVASPENPESIPKAIQLVAGRTAQEYNRRKGRKGAFWQDRYHATAIETVEHLWRCLVYVDLNMVRAGVVKHPSGWKWSRYHEIQHPRENISGFLIFAGKNIPVLSFKDSSTSKIE